MVYLTEHCGFSDFEHNRDKVWSVFFSFLFFLYCFFVCLFCLGWRDGWCEVVVWGHPQTPNPSWPDISALKKPAGPQKALNLNAPPPPPPHHPPPPRVSAPAP